MLTHSLTPKSPQVLVEILQRLQVAKCFAAIGNQVLLHDYFLTLADEVRYIWGKGWGVGKVLFLLTRYPVMVEAVLTYWNQLWPSVSVSTCTKLFNITGWMFIVEVVIAEMVLTTRVWALWARSRIIGILLGIVALACCVVTATVFVKFHTSQQFLTLNDGTRPLPGCYVLGGSNIIVVGYIALLVYETFILGLTLYRSFRRFRTERSQLLDEMLQDGVTYFVSQAAISLVNVLIFLTQPHEYANLPTPLQRSLHSILSARIIIRLRKDAERAKRVIVRDTFELVPIDTLQFGVHTTETRHDDVSTQA